MTCELCELDKQFSGQAMHSNGCPYCCARFIRWVQSSNRVDKKEQIESTLKYAELLGISRDLIRRLYKDGNFRAPKQTSSEKVLESGKTKRKKRR